MLPEQRIPSARRRSPRPIGVPLTGDRGQSLAQSLGRADARAAASWRRSSAPPPACSRPRPARSRSPTPRTASSSTRRPGARARPRSSACGCRRASASPARSSRAATACSCPSAARTRASPARSPPAPATCPYTMVVAPLIRDGKPIGVPLGARPPRRRPVPARGPGQGRAVRRPGRRRARPGHVPAVDHRRPHLARPESASWTIVLADVASHPLGCAVMSSDSHFDAIVVGSGFGGSVTAYRLAEAGKRVLVLERGRPYPPGSFTRSPYRARESFWDPPRGLTGMYHYWSFKGIDALVVGRPRRRLADLRQRVPAQGRALVRRTRTSTTAATSTGRSTARTSTRTTTASRR